MSDKLSEIMSHKWDEISARIRPVPDSELERFAQQDYSGPTFIQALAREDRLSVIAEIKRRSPSAGDIAEQADATEQARIYHNAEADAISVLTDEKYFGGSMRDLWNVTDMLNPRADGPPCLRKDFMLHPIQVVEAAEAGARAILIIVRALEDNAIRALYDASIVAGLDALFEVHTLPELERALDFNPRIVGVNNRDLTRFVTDLAISEEIIPQIPDEIIKVSESGIFTVDDAARASECGADAVLVGEALMKAENVDALIREMHQA